MRYLVLSPLGTFGPADAGTLAQWAREGRLMPDTILQEESTGRKITAGTVPGLVFTAFGQAAGPPPLPPGNTASTGLQHLPPSPYMQPLPPAVVSNYRRPGSDAPLFLSDPTRGKRELTYAFVFVVLGPIGAIFLIHALLLPIASIYGGYVAYQRGRRLGILAMVLGAISFLVAFAIRIYVHSYAFRFD